MAKGDSTIHHDQSATGQCFTRDPGTGDPSYLTGEYLVNSQGGDVAASVQTPKLLFRLRDEMPQAYEQLAFVAQRLEYNNGDMQEIHFTIENGELFVLMSRSGWRTADAAVRIAVDLANEVGTIPYQLLCLFGLRLPRRFVESASRAEAALAEAGESQR